MTKFQRILCSAPALRGACIAAVLAGAAGCGQKGSLYLPTDPAAAGRATLPQLVVPIGNPSPGIPTPTTSTEPAQPTLPLLRDAPAGGTGTGTAAPVRP